MGNFEWRVLCLFSDTYGNANKFQPPDLEDVRESVRQGVTKVAGKISSLANGMMSSLQVSDNFCFLSIWLIYDRQFSCSEIWLQLSCSQKLLIFLGVKPKIGKYMKKWLLKNCCKNWVINCWKFRALKTKSKCSMFSFLYFHRKINGYEWLFWKYKFSHNFSIVFNCVVGKNL